MGHETKTVVVTGGSKGIGRAVCLRFAGEGIRIYFNHYDPDEKDAVETERLVAASGGFAKGYRTNVGAAQEVQAFFKTVAGGEGRIDVLVNNAGITRDALLMRIKETDWDAVLDVNLKGVFLCIQEAAKVMIKQRSGRIINVSSVVAVMGNAGQANYVASKAGVIGLTKTAARELAPRGITVNAVAPGFIDTEMTQVLSDKVKAALLEQVPLRRMGMPEDVAAAVAFLASEEAAYITGQVLHINGGMHM